MPISSVWWPEMLARIFKRRRKRGAATAALPPSVEKAMAALSATVRPDHENRARVLLMWGGDAPSAWHHTPGTTRERLAAAFPDLDGDQLDRACRAADGIVRLAQQAAPTGTRKGWSAKSWATRNFDNANF